MADQNLNEDFEPFQVADLNDVFLDADGDAMTFEVESSDENLTADLDENGLLTLSAVVNWHGQAVVTLLADDGYQQNRLGPLRLPVPRNFNILEQSAAQLNRDAGFRHEESALSLHPQADYHGESVVIITASDESEGLRAGFIARGDGDVNALQPTAMRTVRSLPSRRVPLRDETTDAQFLVTITLVNDAPVWVEYPRQVLRVESGRLIEFEVEAIDVDGDELELSRQADNLPEEARLEEIENGRGQFIWQTEPETSGRFEIQFTASDGVVASTVIVVIEVFHPLIHFTDFEETGASHRLLITSVTFYGEAVSTGWEAGVFTPDGVLCGALRWNGAPDTISVWGADENHADYFHQGENLRFRLWDNEADIEWLGRASVEEGELVWQSQGFTILALEGLNQRNLTLNLQSGWNLISLNVRPGREYCREGEDRGSDVALMTEQLRIDEQNHWVEIMKDEDGSFYAPAWNFCNIGYWNLQRSYLLKIRRDLENPPASVVWSGEPIDAQAPINLAPGWNYIPYYPEYELEAAAPDYLVLSPILDHIELAKNEDGNFLWPELGFSNMPPWRPGEGYQVRVIGFEGELEFRYPLSEGQVAGLTPAVRAPRATPRISCQNLSLLVRLSAVPEGSPEISVFSSTGMLVGSGTIDADGRCGLAVWGDDPATAEREGLVEGEAFTLGLVGVDRVDEMDVVDILAGKGLVYETDAFTAVAAQIRPDLPTEYCSVPQKLDR